MRKLAGTLVVATAMSGMTSVAEVVPEAYRELWNAKVNARRRSWS